MHRNTKRRATPSRHSGLTDAAPTCDIFCRVVDNYGDIGVGWRLARQISREHGFRVRLVVDDLASFRKLVPAIDVRQQEQSVDDVTVVEWCAPLELAAPAALVIEAFGCELPDSYVTAMAHRQIKPVWINLEYLSAEAWVESHHLLPSPHQHHRLIKHFFFPGFTAKTGGVIRESDLTTPGEVADSDNDTELRVFVFAYENCPADRLMSAMAKQGRPIRCLVSEGKLSERLKHRCAFQPENTRERAPVLGFDVVPFVPQSAFDELLRQHDILFVRGEDSLVRALWAAKPFVWQIYPQSEDAHWVKLNAFLDLYCEGLSEAANTALRELWRAWNAADHAAIEIAWAVFYSQLGELRHHAKSWSIRQSKLPDLASNLLSFYQKTTKI